MEKLLPLDSVHFEVIVDNEVDPISPSHNLGVHHPGFLSEIPLTPVHGSDERGVGSELRMSSICHAAHGLSMLITGSSGGETRTMLFDAGPEEDVLEMNASRMKIDFSAVEYIHLSHWHRDHSGGMLRAIKLASVESNVLVGVHPDRPDCRGMNMNGELVAMEPDPSFEEMESAGAVVEKRTTPHTILDGMFLVSGEVPRTTDYELGLHGAKRFDRDSREWVDDVAIKDERFVMCNLKGRGLVVIAGCSHPGITNICQCALHLGGGVPLYAVVGGYHLADGDEDRMNKTMADLKRLGPQVLMPAHCTGWSFKAKIQEAMPDALVPCAAGGKYILGSGA